MKININNRYKVAVTLLAIATIWGCSDTSNVEEAEQVSHHQHDEATVELTEAQYKITEIRLSKVVYKNLSNSIQVNGVLDVPPQNLVDISVPIGGFIVKTDLLQGMWVKKGQLLATLEHPDYVQLQQDYLDKKSRLTYLEREYQRQAQLDKENVNSKKELEKVAADYESLRAQVKGLEEKLAMLNINASSLTEDKISRTIKIYAPIAGYVSEVNVNIGKYVTPSNIIFEIVDTEHLHAELTVYEKDIVNVKKGQKVRFKLPNERGNERLASVYLIGRKIDKDRAVKVHAHLDKEDSNLLPGMYITASIELSEDSVMAVPTEAIVSAGGKDYVYYLKNTDGQGDTKKHVFGRIEVSKGVASSGYVQVSSSEKIDWSSISIVSKGAYSLLSKMENTDEDESGH